MINIRICNTDKPNTPYTEDNKNGGTYQNKGLRPIEACPPRSSSLIPNSK